MNKRKIQQIFKVTRKVKKILDQRRNHKGNSKVFLNETTTYKNMPPVAKEMLRGKYVA